MRTVMVIEDEENLLKGIEINLVREQHRVIKATDGQAAVNLAIRENPDLIILDLMLPGMGGIEVVRELRKHAIDIPIILLTVKDDEIDRVLGLEIGADDYVTKPFSVRELLARVNVQLRRRPSRTNTALERYCFDNIDIDFDKVRATRKGRLLDLTAKEFDVLRFLINSRGSVVTRDQLLNKIWGYQANTTTRTVDNHILKLRHKLEVDPTKPRYILSIYGEGYKFVA